MTLSANRFAFQHSDLCWGLAFRFTPAEAPGPHRLLELTTVLGTFTRLRSSAQWRPISPINGTAIRSRQLTLFCLWPPTMVRGQVRFYGIERVRSVVRIERSHRLTCSTSLIAHSLRNPQTVFVGPRQSVLQNAGPIISSQHDTIVGDTCIMRHAISSFRLRLRYCGLWSCKHAIKLHQKAHRFVQDCNAGYE